MVMIRGLRPIDWKNPSYQRSDDCPGETNYYQVEAVVDDREPHPVILPNNPGMLDFEPTYQRRSEDSIRRSIDPTRLTGKRDPWEEEEAIRRAALQKFLQAQQQTAQKLDPSIPRDAVLLSREAQQSKKSGKDRRTPNPENEDAESTSTFLDAFFNDLPRSQRIALIQFGHYDRE